MPKRDTPTPSRKTTGTTAVGKPAARRKPTVPKTPRKPARKNSSVEVITAGRLFDVTSVPAGPVREDVELVPVEQIVLAANPRRDISPEGIDRLAGMMMRTGQLQDAIGRRTSPTEVVLYAGQRRFLAAKRSPELAGTEDYEGLKPVVVLRVKLLDHVPSNTEIRRLQAQENQHETLCIRDKQDQFQDCWLDHPELCENARIARVCEELGCSATLARNLRRQLTLPEDIRTRVAERPSGREISITMANTLAEMNDTAPALAVAVAQRITSSDHHQQAMQSIGAFVHRTIVEKPDVYAVRLDEGRAVLDAAEEIERGRAHLTPSGREILAQSFGVEEAKLDAEISKLASRARETAFKLDVTGELRERAAAGNYAWVHHRGADYADAIWVVAPEFVLEAIQDAIGSAKERPAQDESYFGAPRVSDKDTRAAEAAQQKERNDARERAAQALNSNLGLGHDIARSVLEPSSEQLDAVRRIVAFLLAQEFGAVLAFGAGWSDRAQQQPVGDTGRFEPRATDAILDSELQRALSDPDPMRGIVQITTRWAAAFMLDQDGVLNTTPLGRGRVAGKLQRALPDGSRELRSAVWELMRPILSPRLADLHRDAFVTDETLAPAADLAAHRAEVALADIDLGHELKAA
jgi:hypothetical protein